MPTDLSNTLVVGISSTALFDLSEADRVFREQGIRAYRDLMLAREHDDLEPGTGFALVRALLGLNRHAPPGGPPLTEVVVMSRNSPETAVRVLNEVRRRGVGITRFAFTGGEPLADYAQAFGLDLFLSTTETDVQKVADAGACATALLYPPPRGYAPLDDQVRIAFDGDAVLFSEESEVLYKNGGLEAFHGNEDAARHQPLPEGPFAAFLKKLAALKSKLPEGVEYSPIRIAVVTARSAPAEARVITTFRAWNVYVDEAFFLGGLRKHAVLSAFRPHIFFDDQDVHLAPAAPLVPVARVLYRTGSPLHPGVREGGVVETVPGVPLTRSPADLKARTQKQG